jgi:hypothetical protein
VGLLYIYFSGAAVLKNRRIKNKKKFPSRSENIGKSVALLFVTRKTNQEREKVFKFSQINLTQITTFYLRYYPPPPYFQTGVWHREKKK